MNFNKVGNIVNDILENILQKIIFWRGASGSYFAASKKTQEDRNLTNLPSRIIEMPFFFNVILQSSSTFPFPANDSIAFSIC